MSTPPLSSLKLSGQAPSSSSEQNPFVTKIALAKRYGVCESTIEKWMAARILVFLKVRRVVRFHVAACDQALRERGFLS